MYVLILVFQKHNPCNFPINYVYLKEINEQKEESKYALRRYIPHHGGRLPEAYHSGD